MRGTRILIALIVCLSAGWAYSADDDCAQPERIVRIDEKNERLFIEASADSVADLNSIRRLVSDAKGYVGKCRSKWSPGWSLSFFSNRKYAGYKDDQAIKPYVMSGDWGNAYLAEYDNATKALVRYPLQPGKRIENRL